MGIGDCLSDLDKDSCGWSPFYIWLNIASVIALVVAIIIYFVVCGVDQPLRTDGVSPGFGAAICAACFKPQGALASVLSLAGVLLLFVMIFWEYRLHFIVMTCLVLGIVVRGIYPGCFGCASTGDRCACDTKACGLGSCSCTGATLSCCRVVCAAFGWLCCACTTFWGSIFIYPHSYFCGIIHCCIYSNFCMWCARCFAFAVPLKYLQSREGGSENGQRTRSQTSTWLPEATVAFYVPQEAHAQMVGWASPSTVTQEPTANSKEPRQSLAMTL